VNNTVVTKFSWLSRSIEASMARGINPMMPMPVIARNMPKIHMLSSLSTRHMPNRPTIAVKGTVRMGDSNLCVFFTTNDHTIPVINPHTTKISPMKPTLTLSTSKEINSSYIKPSNV